MGRAKVVGLACVVLAFSSSTIIQYIHRYGPQTRTCFIMYSTHPVGEGRGRESTVSVHRHTYSTSSVKEQTMPTRRGGGAARIRTLMYSRNPPKYAQEKTPIHARFPGYCTFCGTRIYRGQEIEQVWTQPKKWIHAGCTLTLAKAHTLNSAV